MQLKEFSFHLPTELIAQHPLPERTGSRLLTVSGDTGALADRRFSDLPDLVNPGDVLVLNDTRVVPARLFGRKRTGGHVEILLEDVLDARHARVQIRASKAPRPGTSICIGDTLTVTTAGRDGDFFVIEFPDCISPAAAFERFGHVPLPPYIHRTDDALDRDRYQTVYADRPGAVAAPTAGLHFDKALLDTLASRGVACVFITLHVGSGTFLPVRVDDLDQHRMHPEQVIVPPEVCAAVRRCRARSGRVIAVGTTCVRALETAARHRVLAPYTGRTDLFITPGFRFQVVDALVTNFHLPESTLLMLVSAFGGFRHIMNAYRHAIASRYRFYSYGDAMLVTRNNRTGSEPGPGLVDAV